MKNTLKYSIVVILFLQTIFLFGQPLLPNTTGSFVYTPTGSLSSKPITVYYHIPNGNISTMPILLSFHGDERNGAEYRDYWISMANANGFMVFAPEYSEANYPGGDGYQLGNVFVDGDNPSLATYNPIDEWTFSTVEPLFESIKTRVSGSQGTYDAWGHSGGAQFLQRFRMYLPNSKMNTAICSNAGWYTVPETGIDFPYGIDKSELTTTNFTDAFSKRLIVHLGQNDTDPNSPGLRHNPTVDNQQGFNRLDRGRYFYTESLAYAQSISSSFNWQKQEVAGVGHDPQLMANNALTYLFQSNSNAIASTILDGGFENQPNSLPGGTGGILVISPTNWTANTTGNIVRTTSDTGGRTGPRCAQFGTTSTGAKTFFSPQLPGAFAPNTTYQVQFFYKPTVTTGTVASSSINLYVDNELANPAGTVQSVAAGLSASASTATWTKIAVQITTNGTVAGSNGLAAIAFTTSGTTPNFTANFDDFAVYQGSAPDNIAPNAPGAITATVASNSVANVNWATANGGFDGGGYLVVRYATSTAPSASDDPIQNGIYNVNNTIGAGVVRYIGTATSFTDSGLTAGTDYYYKVYTLDKAFNYSNESTTTSPINSLAIYYYKGSGSLAVLSNWGTNTDGTGIAPLNFTNDFQVFEIRNTTAVATDAPWTIGGNGKVVIGASTVGAVTFTISSGFALSLGANARLDIAAASSGNNEVIFQNSTLPNLGTVDGSANITYANDGVGIAITSIACNTLKISNSTDVSLNNNPSCKFLVVDAGSSITATTQVITLASGGSATINGTYSANRAAGLFTMGTVTSANRGNIHSDDVGTTITLGPNSKIIFSRTTAQTIAPLVYADLEIRGSGVVLTTDITVNNNLTLGSGATVTLNAGKNLTVVNAIANAGTLNIKSNANLIQTNNVPNTGAGITNVERDSSPLFRLDYTLWSSPVAGTQKLLDFSPLTDTDRFYIYNEGTDEYNSVVPSSTNFVAGKGFLIRMPDNSVPFPGTPALWTGTFTGTTPNNGNITLAMTTALNGYNAVGNPYPSTLNIDDFIEANTITNNNIDGTLYFWRKTNDASNPTSYSTCTTLGITSGNTHNYPDSNVMSTGQGFFVKAISNSLNFTNAMRVANNQNQFFRTKQIERNRIWLNLSKGATTVNQMLVGYMTGATLGIDKGIDGKYFNDSPTALNSLLNSEEFAIQGRGLPFDAADTVPLAFKTDVAGDYTIAIDRLDGLFSGSQDIYLVDSKTGAETNLKTSSYPFTAAVGVDNTRFSLRFQKTLNVSAVAFKDNSVSVYKNKETLHINSEALAIANIKVFDIQGRLIAERNNVKANSATISNLKTTHQVVIVKVTGQDGSVISKKIVN